MKVGLVSDTHDNADAVELVLATFRARNVGFVLHAGDVTEPSTLARFGEWRGAVAFGNNDDKLKVKRCAQDMGWQADEVWSGEVGGTRVAMTHGDDRSRLAAAINLRADYVIHGHSHRARDEWFPHPPFVSASRSEERFGRDERVDATRVINPGACYRAAAYSVAVLDVAADTLEIIPITKTADGFD